jgi:hypothetical protein
MRAVISQSISPLEPNFRDLVLAARRMPPEERMLAGARYFDAACDEIKTSIRTHFPQASDAAVTALLAEVIRAAERHGIL